MPAPELVQLTVREDRPVPSSPGAGLPPMCVGKPLQGPGGGQASPVRTPVVVPLAPHQLLPSSAPIAQSTQELGPKTAATVLWEGIGASPVPSILGP